MQVYLSIHDVMPETLPQVATIIAAVPCAQRHKIMLLVVPGKDWQCEDLDQLRQWSAQGMALVGHGWHHQASRIESLWHKLHSLLISRDVAEHLSISSQAELALMQSNRQWFLQHNLPVSDWYVPPAWAFGKLPPARRAESGYRYFESTFAVYDGQAKRYQFMPMLGYEADTQLRKWSVKLWNAVNRLLARWRPLRMGIHPNDLDLLLADELKVDLQRLSSATLLTPTSA